MAEKKYKVVGPHTVAGHAPGSEFNWSIPSEFEAQLVGGGHLKVVKGKGGDGKPAELKCPACAEHGTQAEKKRRYKDLLELREHYGRDHPALAAPVGEEE